MNAPVSARVPPKFVPTLTEVVHVEPPPDAEAQLAQDNFAHAHSSATSIGSSGEAMLYSELSGQANPQDVFDQPQAIADDIVFSPAPQSWSQQESGEVDSPSYSIDTAPQLATAPASIYDLSPELQEQIVHRVMQRVDLSLEMRLRDAVESVMLDHTRNLVPRLREEIEWVVRQSVAEAMAAELERGI